MHKWMEIVLGRVRSRFLTVFNHFMVNINLLFVNLGATAELHELTNQLGSPVNGFENGFQRATSSWSAGFFNSNN